MARTSAKELEHYRAAIERDAKDLGLIDKRDRVILDIGSQTYGRAYRLWTIPMGETGYYDGLGLGSDAFLGMTANEARLSLRGIANGLGLVVYRREQARARRARAASLAAASDPDATNLRGI